MAIEREAVVDLVLDVLKNNFTSKPVNESTILGDVLANDDGYGEANSANAFKVLIVMNFKWWGYAIPVKWAKGWLAYTVGTLADELISLAKPIKQ